jgi:hypothetical protein
VRERERERQREREERRDDVYSLFFLQTSTLI